MNFDGKDMPRKGARVKISDVSDALGLTKSTVSRALNHYPDISETTRTRVQAMADKMGYRPLSHAQAIRTGLVKSLGLVIQMGDHDAQRPFLSTFLAGLSEGASAEGFTLTIATSNSEQATLDTFKSMIRDHKADGFILPRTMVDDPRIALLRAADVPFVLFGRVAGAADLPSYDIKGGAAMHEAVQHLAALGHRQIAFINGGTQYSYAPTRADGFLRGMRDAGLSVNPALMAQDAVTIDQARVAADVMLAAPNPPTAIICAVDMAALGVYESAAACGLEIGDDLSVIGYDGIPEGAHVSPPLSTFAVDFKHAGLRLSNLLIRNIRGEKPTGLQETAAAQFLRRGSTGPAPHSQTNSKGGNYESEL
ncbi:LacI family transcriptional regulator [Loktanella sp. D2R18]|uniref:LacI family DNA-binding transcriptional regulator n=1 Tax=Rhodobacterales TaxID=204455 RepID=UPI000DE90CD8|nr:MULTISPECIES: substrate-binding domain-containing protein [Rhodobacterales]MDO6589974.1 substrate-binding domain-containing protein [Yoonia sp. 1_MG-2023]RBW45886.1 LacI family transcriptional regulator [Loktanella sp. D2R18]